MASWRDRRQALGWLLILVCLMAATPAWAGAAAISGLVFTDRDCDGSQDPLDPALPGWTVYLRAIGGGLPPSLDSATTTTDGLFTFAGLPAGDYAVAIQQRPGYLQSTPPSVDYRLTLGSGDVVTGRNFALKATATCDTTLTFACLGGVNDNFDGGNGPEPASPSAGLLAQLNSCGSALTFFDQPAGADACFGHTFSNCWGTCGPIRATIQMRLRASAAGSQDDELHFGAWPSPGSIWHASLSNLLELATGGADVSWDPGDTMTVTLDLANLPLADRGITNIMAALQEGDLDIYLRNNTEVDYSGGGCSGG